MKLRKLKMWLRSNPEHTDLGRNEDEMTGRMLRGAEELGEEEEEAAVAAEECLLIYKEWVEAQLRYLVCRTDLRTSELRRSQVWKVSFRRRVWDTSRPGFRPTLGPVSRQECSLED